MAVTSMPDLLGELRDLAIERNTHDDVIVALDKIFMAAINAELNARQRDLRMRAFRESVQSCVKEREI